MEFFSRIFGGNTPKKPPRAANPQERLARFKKSYHLVLNIWHKTSGLATDHAASENIRLSFQRLTSILNDESRSPAPHLCLSFASAQEVFVAVAKIASTTHNEGIIREAVALLAALIDSEEEDFLENATFAQALMNFIGRISKSGGTIIGEDTEAEIVELLFGIAAKIRLQPEILPVWFTTSPKEDDSAVRSTSSRTDFAGVRQKEDFPLCYQLIDHVHHDGRIGDFARTGLLYIFESASKSRDLEKWIVESDLATLMASSLGALYSQLSRKLSILHPKEDLPMVLSLSDYIYLQSTGDAESVRSPDFKLHMDTFLSFLMFWQDVLEHCRSIDVRHTLIDHFQILFLQQLLYPSLLESSDVDGGSSVAVLTYLKRILDALDHPELVHMVLHYLLALRDPTDARAHSPRSPLAATKRMSLLRLNEPANEDDRLNPSLFNLVDLILTSSESVNPQTVTSALRLVTIIISKSHHYAVGTLLKTTSAVNKELQRTVGALEHELEEYLALAAGFAGEVSMDEAYESHLKDMQILLESHPCSLRFISKDNAHPITDHLSVTVPPQVEAHLLYHDDPLLKSLLQLLDQFLTNDVETNLALCEAFTMLASCAQVRLESWLAIDPSRYQFDEPEPAPEETSDAPENLLRARRPPSYHSQYAPLLLQQLNSVQSQLDQLRAQIPDLDHHVANRKQTFRVHEEISEAMSGAPSMVPTPSLSSTIQPSLDPPSASWTPQPKRQSRDFPGTHSRAHSPRGRKENHATPTRGTPLATSPAPSRLSQTIPVATPTSSSRSRSRAKSPIKSPVPVRARPPASGLIDDVLDNIKEVTSGENLRREIKFAIKDGQTTITVLRNENGRVVATERGNGTPVPVRTRSEEAVPQIDGAATQAPETDNSASGETIVGEESAIATEDNKSHSKPRIREDTDEDETIIREASLNHILTNVVILQEFVLQIVAIMQIRASLFQEVRFA